VNVKVVSEMLGHASVSITLNIYAHVLPHMQQSAVNAMASLLASPEAGKSSTLRANWYMNWCHQPIASPQSP
jgi:hypothetical protein